MFFFTNFFQITFHSKRKDFQPIPLHAITESILDNEVFKDIQLKMSDDVILKAHKSFLVSRSPVFQRMFENEISVEAQKRTVEIEDIDSKTMKFALKWIYTNDPGNLDAVAADLIFVAEKYEMDELKQLCIRNLIKNLTVNNVIAALKISEALSDAHLLVQKTKEFLAE